MVMHLAPIWAFLVTALYTVINDILMMAAGILPALSILSAVNTGLIEFLPFLSGVAYFIPWSQMAVLGGAYLTAIGSWYIVRSLMKLVHLL